MLERLILIVLAVAAFNGCQFEWQSNINLNGPSEQPSSGCRVLNNSGQGGGI